MEVCGATHAATNNVGGTRTLNALLGLGILDRDVDSYVQDIRKQKTVLGVFMNVRLLVISEAAMFTGFHKLDAIFRKVRGLDRPFGGVQLLLDMDVLQLLPIVENTESRRLFELACLRDIHYNLYVLLMVFIRPQFHRHIYAAPLLSISDT